MRILLLLSCLLSWQHSDAGPARKLLLGVANAAFQVEGSPADSDWRRWTRTPGKIADGTNADVVTRFWTRYEEDFRLARQHGMNAFRISLAWERIHLGPDKFDESALDHYAEMLRTMRSYGLEPVVTLHHFVIPGWIADRGGVLAPDYADQFAAYAAKTVARLSRGSARVRWWMTQNEPLILVRAAYIEGSFPPGKQDLQEALAAAASLARAHLKAIRAIDATGIKGLHLGFATSWDVYDPADNSPETVALTQALEDAANHQFMRAIATGRLHFHLPGLAEVDGKELLPPSGRQTLDYIGVNNYGRAIIARKSTYPFFEMRKGPGPTSDLGWELYPEGMYRALKSAHQYGLPLLVSEFGLADAADSRRGQYLKDHFAAFARARKEGVKLLGILHWSLTDNFEWAQGLKPRFGLVAVDYATGVKTPRPSLSLYQRLLEQFRLP